MKEEYILIQVWMDIVDDPHNFQILPNQVSFFVNIIYSVVVTSNLHLLVEKYHNFVFFNREINLLWSLCTCEE